MSMKELAVLNTSTGCCTDILQACRAALHII